MTFKLLKLNKDGLVEKRQMVKNMFKNFGKEEKAGGSKELVTPPTSPKKGAGGSKEAINEAPPPAGSKEATKTLTPDERSKEKKSFFSRTFSFDVKCLPGSKNKEKTSEPKKAAKKKSKEVRKPEKLKCDDDPATLDEKENKEAAKLDPIIIAEGNAGVSNMMTVFEKVDGKCSPAVVVEKAAKLKWKDPSEEKNDEKEETKEHSDFGVRGKAQAKPKEATKETTPAKEAPPIKEDRPTKETPPIPETPPIMEDVKEVPPNKEVKGTKDAPKVAEAPPPAPPTKDPPIKQTPDAQTKEAPPTKEAKGTKDVPIAEKATPLAPPTKDVPPNKESLPPGNQISPAKDAGAPVKEDSDNSAQQVENAANPNESAKKPKSKEMIEKEEKRNAQFRVACRIMVQLRQCNALESVLTRDQNAILRKFFAAQMENPTPQIIALLHKAMEICYERIMLNGEEYDIYLDGPMMELMKNKEKAKTQLLDVLMMIPDLLPLMWGGRAVGFQICEDKQKSGQIYLEVQQSVKRDKPKSFSAQSDSPWTKMLQDTMSPDPEGRSKFEEKKKANPAGSAELPKESARNQPKAATPPVNSNSNRKDKKNIKAYFKTDQVKQSK